MAVGYKISNGQDFDDILEPRSTSKIANVGYQNSSGTDISNRYENDASGSRFGTTGYRNSGGTDLGQLFAAKGSVVFWDGSLASLNSTYSDGQQDSATPMIEVAFLSDGRIRIRGRYDETFDGRWDGSIADSSNTEVRFVVTSDNSGANFVSNSATTYSQLSSTRVISLQGNERYAAITVEVYLRSTSGSGTISKTMELRTNYSGLGTPR